LPLRRACRRHRVAESGSKIGAGSKMRRVCFGFLGERLRPFARSELRVGGALPDLPVSELVKPIFWSRNFLAHPVNACGVDEIRVPRNVLPPAQATGHGSTELMTGIVKCEQSGIIDPRCRVARGLQRVGLDHIDERPSHPEVGLESEQRLKRLTGAPNAKCSSGRLDHQTAGMAGFTLKPVAQRVEPALQAFEGRHDVALIHDTFRIPWHTPGRHSCIRRSRRA